MRVRTDRKRQKIVEAAAALFIEQGFERTSMSAISARVGGSKATLYGYFASKEELLRAVLEHDILEETALVEGAFPVGRNLRAELVELGVHYLDARLSDLPIANLRTLANLPSGSGIGDQFYRTTLRPALERLARRFETLMADGVLAPGDPWNATMQWRALAEGELLEQRLLGVIGKPEAATIRHHATAAADAFLAIYGTSADRDEFGLHPPATSTG
jgi:AcrR family transcriptional regulator